MKFIDEFREPETARRWAEAIRARVTRPWTLMEVCGGQTHSIVRFGVDRLLPETVRLLHGPGCPVCVTPVELIEKAILLAADPRVTFCSFGDMLRVPGLSADLLSVKARGGDIRIVYSPLDAVRLAEELPNRQVVFFAVGFETTAPANALAVLQARRRGLSNFTLLVSHVLVPPALEAILQAPGCQVQGFLLAGHVCTVMGFREYEPLAERYRVPMVVTGFEPVDLLQGIYLCLDQLEGGRWEVVNQYARSVRPEGNTEARSMMEQVFQVVDRKWRGIGPIPHSGLALRPEFTDFDAERRFRLGELELDESTGCLSGLVLQGRVRPADCPAFGRTCTPEHPLGATMVSSEGACAAYYRYRKGEPELEVV